jgi:hypothetical protein
MVPFNGLVVEPVLFPIVADVATGIVQSVSSVGAAPSLVTAVLFVAKAIDSLKSLLGDTGAPLTAFTVVLPFVTTSPRKLLLEFLLIEIKFVLELPIENTSGNKIRPLNLKSAYTVPSAALYHELKFVPVIVAASADRVT